VHGRDVGPPRHCHNRVRIKKRRGLGVLKIPAASSAGGPVVCDHVLQLAACCQASTHFAAAAAAAAAGRRSTDLLHLVLQNLYFMKHVRGYKGEWRLLLSAVPCW
jgi:hypothetical protein